MIETARGESGFSEKTTRALQLFRCVVAGALFAFSRRTWMYVRSRRSKPPPAESSCCLGTDEGSTVPLRMTSDTGLLTIRRYSGMPDSASGSAMTT